VVEGQVRTGVMRLVEAVLWRVGVMLLVGLLLLLLLWVGGVLRWGRLLGEASGTAVSVA
jgi:hypothetical protein